MTRSNQPPDEETMDWLLDDYWDRQNAGTRPTPADRALDPALSATVRHLHAHDDAPGPDRAFVRRLRKDLTMTTAEPLALPAHPYPTLPPNGRVPDAPARPHREPTRWRPALELIAAASLILAMIGGYFGSDRIRTELGAIVQSDDDPGPEAMLHGNAARTGEMPGPGPEGQPGLLWHASVFGDDGSPRSVPIVADGVIYVTGQRWHNGGSITFLNAIDADSGQVRWSTDVEGLLWGSPAVAGDLVYVGTTYTMETLPEASPISGVGTPEPWTEWGGNLIAFDATTGAERWRYETGGSAYSSPAVVDGVVYVDALNGSLHAVDADTGQRKWRASFPNKEGTGTVASPAVVDGMVYTASNMGRIYALDAETGDVRWSAQTKGEWAQMPTVSNGRVYFAVTKSSGRANGWLAAFDATSGDEIWSQEIGNELPYSPIVFGDKVVLNTGQGGAIVAYNAETGEVAWTFPTGDRISGTPVVVDNFLYVGALSNRLYALDADNGQEIWHVELASWVYSSPAVADGAIFVIGDGILYALGGTTALPGTPVATPLPSGDASGLPPCTAPLRPEWDDLQLEGTPAASVAPVTENEQRYSEMAASRESDLPTGPPAGAETIDAIKETLTQMVPCARPGREPQLASFFTDDFLRRNWVEFNLEHNGGYRFLWAPVSADDFDADDTRVLPDGRVGVLVLSRPHAGSFTVFAERDGNWLVDEIIEVTERPEAHG